MDIVCELDWRTVAQRNIKKYVRMQPPLLHNDRRALWVILRNMLSNLDNIIPQTLPFPSGY
ncbi:hypothetical protein MD484_g6930, partial [Candolleomyces efflorescens]